MAPRSPAPNQQRLKTVGLRETSPRQPRQQFDPVARKGKAAHPFAGLHGQGSFTHRLVPYSSYHGGEERVMPVKVAKNQERTAENAYRIARLRREEQAKDGDPHQP